jgi:hypothetical protein
MLFAFALMLVLFVAMPDVFVLMSTAFPSTAVLIWALSLFKASALNVSPLLYVTSPFTSPGSALKLIDVSASRAIIPDLVFI